MRAVSLRAAPLLCLLLAACPSCPPVNVDQVAECKALYHRCVDVSKTMAEYEKCRANVDAQCLANDGQGGQGGGK